VGRESAGRQSADRSTGLGANNGKTTLVCIPIVGHALAIWHEFVAPYVGGLLQPAPGGIFPLRLGRQTLAGPLRIGFGVLVAHLHHRVVTLAFYAAARPLWLTPVCTRHITPPFPVSGEAGRALGANEHHSSRHQGFIRWTRCARWQLHPYDFPVGLAFRRRDVTCFLHETRELVIGDMGEVHPETLHPDLVSRLFVDLCQLA